MDFYGRRALEESRAAAAARCPRIGAAHRRMAAAYALRVQAEAQVVEQLAAMLAELDGSDEAADLEARA